ncbi:30S ribosomal protein S6, partial [Wolbachia endosymbiont of Pentidionis agamae]|uniref:30S ribosomal protein S6 n=1 Tax=Wolbachia endosymbiont of Pentidionis agamae TaxID=3110435 RepID=UPI002FD45426
ITTSGLIKYEYWGLLDFAYPINKMKKGHYCVLCISSAVNIINEFKRRANLNEDIIRYLNVQVDKVFEDTTYMESNKHEE